MTMLNTRNLKPYQHNDTSPRTKKEHSKKDWTGNEDQLSFKTYKPRHRSYKIGNRFFRLPLAVKLIIPNIVIIATVACFMYVRYERSESSRAALATTVIALSIGLTANSLIFFINLRPIREIERTAQLVWSGDRTARVSETLLDNQTLHAGQTVNLLLDSLAANRIRTRSLVEQIVQIADKERAMVTKQLYDSTIHALDAITRQIGFASEYANHPDVIYPLDIARNMIQTISQDLNILAQTTYPSDLKEHGLLTALQNMAGIMRTSHVTPINIVHSDDHNNVLRLSSTSASVLYQVSHESVRNALQHARSTQIEITLEVFPTYATIQIVDDGLGFDIGEAVRDDRYLGLDAMREKVGLVNGEFQITSTPNEGTTVYARIPVKES